MLCYFKSNGTVKQLGIFQALTYPSCSWISLAVELARSWCAFSACLVLWSESMLTYWPHDLCLWLKYMTLVTIILYLLIDVRSYNNFSRLFTAESENLGWTYCLLLVCPWKCPEITDFVVVQASIFCQKQTTWTN